MSFKVKSFRRIVVLLIAAILILAGFFAWDQSRIGTPIAEFNGVQAHHNGLFVFGSHGKNFDQKTNYYFGQTWQCVEYIKRYLFLAHGHRLPDGMGHAKSFFDPNIKSGELNARRGLRQFSNPSPTLPQPGDVLVFTEGVYGHVAIVSEVGESSVEVIQQNIWGLPKERLPLLVAELGGRKTYKIGRTERILLPNDEPAGWLRVSDKKK